MTHVVDLFAGPGGWDEGLHALGCFDVLGVEHDQAACATAEAAGHRRMQADVAALDPHDIAGNNLWGLIASPPLPGVQHGREGQGPRRLRWALDLHDALVTIAAQAQLDGAA